MKIIGCLVKNIVYTTLSLNVHIDAFLLTFPGDIGIVEGFTRMYSTHIAPHKQLNGSTHQIGRCAQRSTALDKVPSAKSVLA